MFNVDVPSAAVEAHLFGTHDDSAHTRAKIDVQHGQTSQWRRRRTHRTLVSIVTPYLHILRTSEVNCMLVCLNHRLHHSASGICILQILVDTVDWNNLRLAQAEVVIGCSHVNPPFSVHLQPIFGLCALCLSQVMADH